MKKLLLFTSLLLSAFFIYNLSHVKVLFADYPVEDPYIVRPTKPKSNNVRIRIGIRDDLSNDNRINTVYFDGDKLELSPPDYLGSRGRFYFKTSPGKHLIRWTILSLTDSSINNSYEQSIDVQTTDALVNIEIFSDQLTTDSLH